MATISMTYTGPGGGSTKNINFANTDLQAIQDAYTYFAQAGRPAGAPPMTPDEILALLATEVQSSVQAVLRRHTAMMQPPPIPPITQS